MDAGAIRRIDAYSIQHVKSHHGSHRQTPPAEERHREAASPSETPAPASALDSDEAEYFQNIFSASALNQTTEYGSNGVAPARQLGTLVDRKG